jgi:hypothetical protein
VVRLGGDDFSLGDVDLPLCGGAGSLNVGGGGVGRGSMMTFSSLWSHAVGLRAILASTVEGEMTWRLLDWEWLLGTVC